MERVVVGLNESFEDGIDSALTALEELNMAEPLNTYDITIILRTTGQISPNGKQVVNTLAYVDADMVDILDDLEVVGL